MHSSAHKKEKKYHQKDDMRRKLSRGVNWTREPWFICVMNTGHAFIFTAVPAEQQTVPGLLPVGETEVKAPSKK